MAEVFGVVTGALSVAALFNNCVDCFTYIQLGRHIGRDYQTCQLKLDVAWARLSRWGDAVGANRHPAFGEHSPKEQPVQLAKSILEEIISLFQAAHKTSLRYQKTATLQDLVVYTEADLNPVFWGLHDRLKSFARRRQQGMSLLKKTTWALYDGQEFENTVNRISSFIDDLEKLFPMDAVCAQLAALEIEELSDGRGLAVLKEVAQSIDRALFSAAAQLEQTIKSRNSAEDINASNDAAVQVGNEYGEAFLRSANLTEQTSNSAKAVNTKDTAKVQVGSRFGVSF